MPDFEGSGTIATSPDRLFNYLADVRHLPDYFPKALSAKARNGEDLAIILDLDGEATEVHAWYRVEEKRRMLQWGIPAAGFQGWLAVIPNPTGCELTVSVQRPTDDDADEIDYEFGGMDSTDAEIRDTIDVIRRIMSRPST